MRRVLSALLLGGAIVTSGWLVPAVAAAPITCPPGQTVVKTDTGWICQNNGSSGDPSTEDPKNPNALRDMIDVTPLTDVLFLKKVEKTAVCHWDDNDNQFDLIRIPTKQLDKGVGHARHDDDVIPAPDEGCDGLEAPEEDEE